MGKETVEEIAERIATRAVGRNPNCATRWQLCKVAIVSALKARDERAAQIADAAENKWIEDARNVARADDLVGGLAQSTYTRYAEVAHGIAATIRGRKE